MKYGMKVATRLLYYEMKRKGYNIHYNKIHSYLRETGRTIPNPKKQKRRSIDDLYAIVWLDDASRFVLTAGEFSKATTEHSIQTLKEAQKKLNSLMQ